MSEGEPDATQASETEAVRMAREGEGEPAFGILEGRQLWHTPSMSLGLKARLASGAVKALAMIAAPAGLLLPLGGSDFGQQMSGEGFRGDDLRVMVLITFWFAAIGQVWVLIDWWRRGRERAGDAIATSVLTLLAAAVAPWWFALGMSESNLRRTVPAIVVIGVLALLALVAHLGLSLPTVPNRKRIQEAQQVQQLPQMEQRALREERETILQVLQERGRIDATRAEAARATPLGERWRLDEESKKNPW